MTIKKRLFFSNVRMILVAVAAFSFTARVIMYHVQGVRHDPQLLAVITVLAVFIIIVSVLSNYFTHRITKRIAKMLEPLDEGARQIHAGNLDYRIDYRHDDEFRPVCEAFDKMAAKLKAAAALQKKDEANRKELIAGISHDLRTPLTSIIGCAEGINTGIASTPEMKEKYLGFIKNEALHMKHIIEQLFLF